MTYFEARDLGNVDSERSLASLFLKLVEEHELVGLGVKVEGHGAVLDYGVVFELLSQLVIVSSEECPALFRKDYTKSFLL